MSNVRTVKKIQKLTQWILILGIIGLVSFAVTRTILWEIRPRTLVSIGNQVFRSDVASTNAAREKGLSGRQHLGSDEAMLFEFDSDKQWAIWMKDMKIPLDIIWLDSDHKVIHIEKNAKPDAKPYKEYTPSLPARYVLEIPSGQADKANISVGSTASFNVAKEGLRK